jgi:hypothetical protein
MRRAATLFVFALLTGSSRVQAADVWAIGGQAATQLSRCTWLFWDADVRFFNVRDTPAVVRILHVSNGGSTLSPDLMIPANGSVRSRVAAAAEPPMWMMHFEVPDGVLAEGRLEMVEKENYFCSSLPPNENPMAKLSMPIFSRLAPAGEPQYHLGTDLGEQRVRLNVGIYNAGVSAAAAHVVVHRPFCRDTAGIFVDATVEPDTLEQLSMGTVTCQDGTWWPAYVSVTVNQPSLSFVSTLSNDSPPAITSSVSR